MKMRKGLHVDLQLRNFLNSELDKRLSLDLCSGRLKHRKIYCPDIWEDGQLSKQICELGRREKVLLLSGNELRFLNRLVRSLVTIITEILEEESENLEIKGIEVNEKEGGETTRRDEA